MLFPKHIQSIISKCAYLADKAARVDLAANNISSENDYTSNFTVNFRNAINAKSMPGLRASAKVLGSAHEQKYGVDGAVILANKNDFKIGLFEAKWPRIKNMKYPWDRLQSPTSGVSHFHHQLYCQRPCNPKIAIWEMFYCEYALSKQPSWFPNEGSACMWHDTAYQESEILNNHNMIWNNLELKRVLQKEFFTIEDIIGEICKCNKGVLFRGGYSIDEFLNFADFLFANAVVVEFSGGFEDER